MPAAAPAIVVTNSRRVGIRPLSLRRVFYNPRALEEPMRRRLISFLLVVLASAPLANAQTAPKRAPGLGIPTIAINNVARQGFFYAGGKYVGELGPEKESTMGGAMYVEVLVPKQIRSPYPI